MRAPAAPAGPVIRFWRASLPFLLVFLVLGFAHYAFMRGMSFFDADEIASSRLYHSSDVFATAAIYLHMSAGGCLSLLAPLQLVRVTRSRWPLGHRITGYGIALLAFVTAFCGLIYILRLGTIGATPMSLGFALYGVLLAGSAWQTVRFARAGDARHRNWALRLVVLALGSWLYRVHYGLWEIATGGLWSNPDFTGAFDLVQVVAFYLPYLFFLELWLRRHPVPRDQTLKTWDRTRR